MGVPGWPDLACWTASIERVRIVLMASRVVSSVVMKSPFAFLRFSCFECRDLADATEVSLSIAIFGREKCLHQVPGDGRAHCAAAHTKNVHMIVFHALPGRKMVVNQRCAGAWNLISANGSTHPAPTNGDASLDFAS